MDKHSVKRAIIHCEEEDNMSVQYKGFKTGVLYKAESAYGTPVTVDTAFQGKITSHSAEWNNNFFRETGLGEGRNATFIGYGGFDATGSIEGFVGRWDFFQHLVGVKSGAGTAASKFVLTEGDNVGFTGNDIKSFTMQVGSDESTDDVDTYAGCLLNNATFTANEGELLRFSADWIGKTVATNTALVTYTPDTTAFWNFAQGTVKFGATPTAVTKVSSFAITISNNMYVYRSLGARFIEQPETGLRRYDFTLTVRFSDAHLAVLQQGMLGQANSPYPATANAAAQPGSDEIHLYFTGPTNQEATIQLDEANIDSMSKPVNVGEGIKEVTFTGFAMKGLSNIPIKWQVSA
jgi:hypothetical protein